MEQHLQQFTDLLQRIADTREAIPAKLQVAMLLCSLPDSYDPLTTALEQRPRDELAIELVKSKLLAEAEKRRERTGCATGTSEKALRMNFEKWKRAPSSSGAKDSRVCYHCGKPRHLRRNCRILQKEATSDSGKKQEGANQRKKEDAKAKQANVDDGPLAWMVG